MVSRARGAGRLARSSPQCRIDCRRASGQKAAVRSGQRRSVAGRELPEDKGDGRGRGDTGGRGPGLVRYRQFTDRIQQRRLSASRRDHRPIGSLWSGRNRVLQPRQHRHNPCDLTYNSASADTLANSLRHRERNKPGPYITTFISAGGSRVRSHTMDTCCSRSTGRCARWGSVGSPEVFRGPRDLRGHHRSPGRPPDTG